MLYLIEQCLNGIQLGMLLFLLAAGLTLIFGIMDLVNLAHGSLYMLGAYFAATFAAVTDSFLAGIGLGLAATLVAGMAMEVIAIRPLYGRDHLDHVLGTFGLLIFFNELVRLIWGPAGLTLSLPAEMLAAVQVLPGVYYPIYRLVIILATFAVALLLYFLVMRTRIGMLIRAGASNREMVGALGINIKLLYTLVFGLGAALAGFAGMMQAPLAFVQIGMGENILILAFVVIIIGGIGSIRGALVAAIIVGLIDTMGRAFLPDLVRHFLSYSAGSSAGPALSSMLIYTLMAAILVFRPRANDGLAHSAQCVRGCVARDSRAAAGLCRGDGQHIHHDAVHAHRDPRDRGGEPEPDHGLRRHGEFRPCRLSRHRRLCGRHSRQGGHRHRLRAMAARAPAGRPVRARRRRAQPAHARGLFHHDHARLRADGLLHRQRARSLRRRRRIDDPATQRVWRAGQPVEPDVLLLPVSRAAGCDRLWRLAHGQFAFRPGDPRLALERPAHARDRLSDVPLQARLLRDRGRAVRPLGRVARQSHQLH